MKAKIRILVMLVFIALMVLSGKVASASEFTAEATIEVRLIIPPNASLKLDDEWVHQNLQKPEAEAFSELKESGILVDKIKREDTIVWLFTKTE